MTLQKLHLLRRIAHAPRTLRGLTDGSVTETTSIRHTERWLAELIEDGLLTLSGNWYGITEDGRAALQEVVVAPARSWGPMSTQGNYTSPKWQTRAGPDAFMQCRSVGMPT